MYSQLHTHTHTLAHTTHTHQLPLEAAVYVIQITGFKSLISLAGTVLGDPTQTGVSRDNGVKNSLGMWTRGTMC